MINTRAKVRSPCVASSVAKVLQHAKRSRLKSNLSKIRRTGARFDEFHVQFRRFHRPFRRLHGGSQVRRFSGSQVRRFQFAGSHAGSQVRIPRISRQFRQFKPPLADLARYISWGLYCNHVRADERRWWILHNSPSRRWRNLA